MSRTKSFLLFALLISALFCNVIVRAQEATEEDENVEVFEDDSTSAEATKATLEETEEVEVDDLAEQFLDQRPDIETAFIFPDYPDRRFVIGEPVTLLINFFNKGVQAFNISHISAALHSPFDYSYHIQNFTAFEVGTAIGPKTQITLEYMFFPARELEPVDYWFSAHVVYNSSETRVFRSTVYNGTIDLIEKYNGFDLQQLFNYVLFFAVLGGLGYGGYLLFNSSLAGKRKGKKTGGKAAPVEPSAKVNQEDWLAGINYKPSAKKDSSKKTDGSKKAESSSKKGKKSQ